MKAIILAAGIGNRLGEMGKKVPKCLIEIGEKTLLERQLGLLKECGIDSNNIVVVIGGMGKVWSEKNKNRIKKIHKNVIINDKNVKRDQAYSLWLAIKDINDGIVCLDGDSIFEKEMIKKIINSKYPSTILTRRSDMSEKRRRVLVKNNRILRIGLDVKSEKIYIPILKLSSDFVIALKEELKSGKYFNGTIEVPVNQLCKSNFIYSLDWGSGNKEPITFNINTLKEYEKAKNLFE